MSEPARYLFPADRMLGDAGRFGWPGVSLSRGELSDGTVPVILQGCKSDSIVAPLRDRGFARCTCATVVAHVGSGVALGR